jgi:hypothetical protein
VLCGDCLEILAMSKKWHVGNSQFKKVMRDVHSFFQDEGLKIKNNQAI